MSTHERPALDGSNGPRGSIQELREKGLRWTLWTAFGLGSALLAAVVSENWSTGGGADQSTLYFGLYLFFAWVCFGRGLSYRVRSLFFLGTLLAIAISELWYYGVASLAAMFFLATVIFSGLLAGVRTGFAFMGLSLALFVGSAALYHFELVPMTNVQQDVARQALVWAGPILSLLYLSGSALVLQTFFSRGLQQSISTATDLVENLSQEIDERKLLEEDLRNIARGFSAISGTEFFQKLVLHLSETLSADCVLVGQVVRGKVDHVVTIAVAESGKPAENMEYVLTGTPCENVVAQTLCVYPRDVQGLFPTDILLSEMGIESYAGVPLHSSRQDAIGLLVVMYKTPLENDARVRSLLEIFASRSESELERLQAEAAREKLEAQLLQSQRLESVGTLAGGIAHDFNNLLQAILGYGDMAMSNVAPDSRVHSDIEQMIKAGERATVLVRQLLAFSRQQVLELSQLRLDEVIEDLVDMIRRVIGEHITLDFVSGHDLGLVRADRGQIEQILMNLCVNARDAMGDGGTLTIATDAAEFDEAFCEAHTWASPGRYASLSVSDTGCGMDEETQQRMFEPFFTTKEPGKGTGLGLSTVFGIVRQHNGMIDIYSEIGSGTTIRIYLPTIDATETTHEEVKAVFSRGGTETILLADDDEMVCGVTGDMLCEAGYTVLKAADGEEAILEFDKHAGEIDLVLLDVVMPRLGGKAVAEYILKHRPELPIIFCSGYSRNAVHSNFVLDDGMHLLQKPYHREELLRKVREVIESGE